MMEITIIIKYQIHKMDRPEIKYQLDKNKLRGSSKCSAKRHQV